LATSILHGGDLGSARRRFGEPARGWLDLSTGINPLPYPIDGLTLDDWTRLPAREAEADLEAVAARAFRLADPARLVATPGTQAVIQALPWLMPAKSVAILDFTYQEHDVCWRAQGADVRTIKALTEREISGADVVVVVNPNNPNGRLIAPADLLIAADILARRGGTLIIDEAFVDVLDPAASVMPVLPDGGIVVLRSVGKTWGLAGLRLGFVTGPLALVERMRGFFGPWAVNGPALRIGATALADEAWLRATIARLTVDCAALDAILRDTGLEIIGGTPLFRLARHPDAAAIFARLGRAGILIRPFPDRPDWLRFGIPATNADRTRLAEALRS
jgi:cobalamin biosynthetic protein CobC